MILLSGQSLTPARKLRPEALGLNLEEKKSTATLELGPEDPEIAVGTWMLDDEPGCGEGIVWRVRSADMNYNTETRSLSLEHIINTLQDQVLFGETTWEDIAGAGASACSAKQAIQYVLSKQSLWRLGDFDFDDIAWPYQFNGDTLYSAIQTVTNSCPDSCWEYDLSRIPFRLHVRRIPDETTCEMRAGRNIKTLKRVIDRSGMYTRFYPIGKDDLHLTGEYISRNESTYGMVAKVETFSGAETESALRSWAWERLKRHCQPKVTVTIGGLELSESTGEPLDKLTMSRKCRVPLPEFSTTITERIIRIRVTDKIRKPEEVTVTLGNELPDLASIVGEVEKEQASGSGGGGRGGMKKAGEDHAWFVDTDTHVGMVAEAIIGHSPDGVDWSRVAEVIVDGDGIHNRVTRAEGYLVTMEAKIDLTEEKLRAEFNNIADSLRSELEMSAESLRVEFENLNNSTRSELLITSESLRAEFENLNNSTRSELLITSESLRAEFTNEINSTRSELQITSESLRTEFTNEINSTRSELEITSESLRSTITDTASGLQTQIDQNKESINLKVSKGDVGTQLAVELGNVTITGGNLVVDGYVTAAGLEASIAELSVVRVKSIQAEGTAANLSLPTVTAQSNLYVGTGAGSVELISAGITDAITDLNLSHTAGTATYTLQKKTISSNSSWTDVGSFSKAATLSVEYGGDNAGDTATYTVTGTPAENFPGGNTATGTFVLHVNRVAAWITDEAGTIRARLDNTYTAASLATAYGGDNTGDTATYTVTGSPAANFASGNTATGTFVLHISRTAAWITDANGTIRARLDNTYPASALSGAYSGDNTGATAAYTVTGTPSANFADGNTKTGTFEVHVNVNAAWITDGAGTVRARVDNVFEQATVTPQGTAYGSITPISSTSLRLGAKVAGRLISSNSVRLGTKTSYTKRGSSHSPSHIYTRNTSALKLHHDGSKTYYVAPSVGAQGYTRDWYYVDSGGTSYYTSSGSGYYIEVSSSSDKLYESGGSTGDVYPVVTSGGTVYYTANSSSNIDYYPVVSSGGTLYYTAGTAITGLRNAGTADSTTYYKKKS